VQGLLTARTIFVALVCAVALRSFAARQRFLVRYDGQPATGSEVCIFPAGDESDPFALYLSGREVRCFPADKVLDIPPGKWFFHAKRGKDLVSAQVATITNRGTKFAPDTYGETQIDLRPAATLDFTNVNEFRGADDAFAIYLSNEGTECRPALLPVPPGDRTALVPAGMRLLVLKTRFSHVIDVSEPLIGDGLTVVPPFQSLPADRVHLLAWIDFRPEARDPDAEWQTIPAPAVVLNIGGRRVAPEIPPRPGFGSDGALMLFRNVPLGNGMLMAGGGIWTRDELVIDATRTGVVVMTRGAVVAPATMLTVRWSGSVPTPKNDDCAPATKQAKAPVRLLVCEGARCSEAATPSSLDLRRQIATFEGLRPGSYTIEIGDQRSAVAVKLGEQMTHDVALHPFRLFGRVTIDDRPVRARLEFASGIVVTDADGRYDVDLTASPRDVPVDVFDCADGHLLQTAIPEHALEANQPYDVDIQHNHISVNVVDAGSGRSVAGAAVHLAALKSSGSDEANFVTGTDLVTGSDGTARIDNVLSNHPLVICARSERYERACSDELSFTGTRAIDVTLALHSKTRLQGRVRSSAAIQSGRIFFVGADAKVREWSAIQPDGVFFHRLPHALPEYAVVVSNLPLLAVPLAGGDATIDIAMPAAVARDVDVAIRSLPQQDGLLTLFIGDRQIPEQAFSWHQSLRGMQSIVFGGGPLRIPQIFETAAITVGLGPAPKNIPATLQLGPDADLCRLPGFAACRRKTLSAGNAIIF